MWSSIISFFTGGGDTTDKVVDGIVNGVDALWFTDEEKSQASQKILDFKLKYAQSTTGQNKARRVIAFIIVGLWAFLVVLAVMLKLYGEATNSKFVFEVLKDIVLQPFTVVVGFYFLTHIVRSFNK